MAEIGIKLADGSFFPIFDDTTASRKRVVLTTAQAHQDNVQIDLLRRDDEIVEHVGYLLLEEIDGSNDDILELILTIGIDDDGNLDAYVETPSKDQYQSLAVNVYRLEGSDAFDLPDVSSTIDGVEDFGDIDVPDFDLDSDGMEVPEMDDEVFVDEPEVEADYDYTEDSEDSPRSFSVPALIAILLIVLSLIALAAFGIFSLLETEGLPELRAVIPLLLVVPRKRTGFFRRYR